MWDPPGPVEDVALARLPFPTAQRLLARPVVRGSARRTRTEWHGNSGAGDPELGSFCMARVGGPNEDLIGERLRVRYGTRAVYAVCHRAADLDEDLSLTRTLFARLTRLDTTSLPVIVEVLT
jgi:hypothetical protein